MIRQHLSSAFLTLYLTNVTFVCLLDNLIHAVLWFTRSKILPKPQKKKKNNAVALISHGSHRAESISAEVQKVGVVSDATNISSAKNSIRNGKIKSHNIKQTNKNNKSRTTMSCITSPKFDLPRSPTETTKNKNENNENKNKNSEGNSIRHRRHKCKCYLHGSGNNNIGSMDSRHHHGKGHGMINFSVKNIAVIGCDGCGKSTFCKQVQSWFTMSPSLLTGELSSIHIGGMSVLQSTLVIPQSKIKINFKMKEGIETAEMSQSMTRANKMYKNKKNTNTTTNNSKNSTKHISVASMDLANISINNNIHNDIIRSNHRSSLLDRFRLQKSILNYRDENDRCVNNINNVSIKSIKNTVAVGYGLLHGGVGFQYQHINAVEKRANIFGHNIDDEKDDDDFDHELMLSENI